VTTMVLDATLVITVVAALAVMTILIPFID